MQSYLGNGDASLLIKLLPFFLGGALLYLLRTRIPLHWLGAIVSVLVGATLVIGIDGWGMQAAAPFVTYVILWGASVVPAPRIAQRRDISYGVYIYAFPVQQLLAVAGCQRWGRIPGIVATPEVFGSSDGAWSARCGAAVGEA